MIFILYRTAENNQRHLSHGFKNISFRDNMYVDQSRPLSVFLVKAELRKFGEVRSHPPHPPWLRHWIVCFVLEHINTTNPSTYPNHTPKPNPPN